MLLVVVALSGCTSTGKPADPVTAGPTVVSTSAGGNDPCVVGPWRLTVSTRKYADVTLTLSKGSLLVLVSADGTGFYDLSGKPTFSGRSVNYVQSGTATFTYTARGGVWQEKLDLSKVTSTVTFNGVVQQPVKQGVQNNKASYTCKADALAIWNEFGRNEYRRAAP